MHSTPETTCATCGEHTTRIHDASDVACYALALAEEAATAAPVLLGIADLQADPGTRQRNAARHSASHDDECFLCGRGLTQRAVDNGWLVWLSTRGGLFPVATPSPAMADDQGWFPVGSECAKRVPLAYRMRTAQAQAI